VLAIRENTQWNWLLSIILQTKSIVKVQKALKQNNILRTLFLSIIKYRFCSLVLPMPISEGIAAGTMFASLH
jgi:hypothetical protein